MKSHFFSFVLMVAIIFVACKVPRQETIKHFTTQDESLIQYQIPEWYKDAKFGYWCTWGVYSIPAYAGDHAAEWYGRWMYTEVNDSMTEKEKAIVQRGLKTAAYHRKNFGDPSSFGYKDFIPMFKAEKWDADEWADLFQEGGAKFFMFMGMHHDNFCLWDSDTQPFNSVKMGPKRDFAAEMKKAVKERGMYFGLSNHSAWNGSFFQFNHKNGHDGLKQENQALYGTGKVDSAAIARWWATTIELADKYQPDLYYFDWGWNIKPFEEKHRRNFLEFYYNKAIDWGYGNLLLSVGPKADGTIPDEAKIPIKQIGAWLKTNGEAVYATRPWKIYGEGPTIPSERMHGDQVEYTARDIRFTCSKDNKILYITFLGYPEIPLVASLANLSLNKLKKASLLSSGKEINCTSNSKGLLFETFPKADTDINDFAYVIKLEFKNRILSE